MDEKQRRKQLQKLPFSKKLKILKTQDSGEAPRTEPRNCCLRAAESQGEGFRINFASGGKSNKRQIVVCLQLGDQGSDLTGALRLRGAHNG